jgi:FkbM family methyltransferase
MKVVFDIGCLDWGTETSIDKLIERYQPDVFYGYDPHPEQRKTTFERGKTLVMLDRAAAWKNNGTLRIDVDSTRTHVAVPGEVSVRCFDLAAVIRAEADAEIILKLDCEGAEYVLLPHLISTGAIHLVDELLIEWHGPPATVPIEWEAWE